MKPNPTPLHFLPVIPAILLLAALAGCSGHRRAAVRPPCPAGQVCLELGNESEPLTLDPNKLTDIPNDRVVGEMFVGLTQSDAAGRTIPGVADRWTTSADGLTWTFHLRDARWSDGVPLTAGDFVFGLRRLLDPSTASAYASLMYVIRGAQSLNEGKAAPQTLGVKALDPHTLEIDLAHPAPYLPELAKHQTMYPLPRHVVQRWGPQWTDPAHYVSDGPYKLVDWRFGDRLRMVKNPYFWEADQVCVDRADYYPAIDANEAEQRVRRGELDTANSVPSNRVPFLRRPGQIPAYVRTHTYLGVYYVFFDRRRYPAFRDRRVRLALSLAVDRDFITGKLLRAGQTPAYGFAPAGVAGYAPPPAPAWAAWPLARRQAAARALLAQAGYGPGQPLRFELTYTDSADAVRLTPALQSDWAQIGVAVALVQDEPQIAFQDYQMRNFQAGYSGWIADYDDAMSFLYLMQSTTGAQNYGDYANPAYDALIRAADQEPDAARRAAVLQRAEALMIADAAVTPLYFAVNRNLVSPRITGWVDDINNVHRLRWLCVKGR